MTHARVLVVDDDEGTRETVGRYLTLEGYAVVLGATGADALREAEGSRFDAVLLDYHLPDIDGLGCLRELRARGVQAPVVMFSADSDVETDQPVYARLDATVLFKLCELPDVRDALASVISPLTCLSRDRSPASTSSPVAGVAGKRGF